MVPLTSRVLRLAGSPPTACGAAMLAVLDAGPGAVLARESALALWATPGFALEPCHVAQPRGGIRRTATFGRLHTSRRIPPEHISVLDGIPVTRPGRSVFDLAATAHPGRVARALDSLWARRLVSGPLLFALLDELGASGRRGIGTLRTLLDERGRDWVPPVSGLERRFHHLVAADGQEPLEREVDAGGAEWIGRIDGYDRPARLFVEIDSDLHHTAFSDVQADARRDARLRELGLDVVRYTEHQVWYEPAWLVRDLWQRRQAGRAKHGHPPLVRGRAA